MKRLLILIAIAAAFTACKKDKGTTPTPDHVTPTPLGRWFTPYTYLKSPTITDNRLYWDNNSYDGDSIVLTKTLIIKQYRHGAPDTAFIYLVSADNDTLHLLQYYNPTIKYEYLRVE